MNAQPLRLAIVAEPSVAEALQAAIASAKVNGKAPAVAFVAHNTLQAVAQLHHRRSEIDAIALQLDAGVDADRVVLHAGGDSAGVIIGLGTGHIPALRAFDLGAVAFLPPPFPDLAVEQGLQRAADRLAERLAAAALPPSTEIRAPQVERIIDIPTRRGVVQLPVQDILYVASVERRHDTQQILVRTRAHSYKLFDSIRSLAAALGPGFIRTHQAALVAERAVAAYRPTRRRSKAPGSATLTGAIKVRYTNEWLPVAQSVSPAIRRRLQDLAPSPRLALARRPANSDILYVVAEGKCVRLHTLDGSYLDNTLTLDQLVRDAGARLIRIHRSAAVAVSAISEYVPPSQVPGHLDNPGGGAVRIAHTGQWLPVARRVAGHVKKTLTVGSP